MTAVIIFVNQIRERIKIKAVYTPRNIIRSVSGTAATPRSLSWGQKGSFPVEFPIYKVKKPFIMLKEEKMWTSSNCYKLYTDVLGWISPDLQSVLAEYSTCFHHQLQFYCHTSTSQTFPGEPGRLKESHIDDSGFMLSVITQAWWTLLCWSTP